MKAEYTIEHSFIKLDNPIQIYTANYHYSNQIIHTYFYAISDKLNFSNAIIGRWMIKYKTL